MLNSDKKQTDIAANRRAKKAELAANDKNLDLNFPKGFKKGSKGLDYYDPLLEEPAAYYVSSWIDVTGRTCDEKGNSHGRILEFKDTNGKKKRWVMPMALLAGRGDDLFRTLLDMGMLINRKQKAKDLFAEYIQNCTDRPLSICVTKPGWFDGCYVMPNITIGSSEKNIVLQTEEITDLGFSSLGSHYEWRDQIAGFAKGNSRLSFGISAAFAAPLLSLFGIEGGGFHFRGISSKGKTLMLNVAGSVWGSHDRLRKWRATSNGLERTAEMHNHSLLLLDEVGEMKPADIGETVYMLADGMGRDRMNQTRTKTWNLLFLSTGEITLKTAMEEAGKKVRAGQEVRMVDIPIDVGKGLGLFDVLSDKFKASSVGKEVLKESSKNQAEHIKNMTKKYYGSVGPMFLDLFIQKREQADNFIKETQEVFIKENLPDKADSQVGRVLNRFAFIAAVGELATSFGLTGWEPLEAYNGAQSCFQAWLNNLVNHDDSQEVFEALRTVRLFLAQFNSGHFEDLDITEDRRPRPMTPAYGYKGGVGQGEKFHYVYYIDPSVFVSVVCKGLDYKTALTALKDKGFLKLEPNGKNPPREKHKIHKESKDGQTPRCYAVLSTLLDSDYI